MAIRANWQRLMFAVCCAAPSMMGCASLTPSLGTHVDVPERSAVIFFVDGLDPRCLQEMVETGRVPNITRQFVERGVEFAQAYSCIPADTYPNAVSLITGKVPGRHGVVGNLWFDRYGPSYADYTRALTYLDVDYHLESQTIYERIRPLTSVSIQCATAHGSSAQHQGGLIQGLQWAAGNFSAIDSFSADKVTSVVRQANRSGQWPALQMYYFPAVDKYGHEFGPETTEYERAVEHVDRCIGRVLDSFDRLGTKRETLFVLVSDHGQINTPAAQQLEPVKILAQHWGEGLKIARSLSGSQQTRYREVSNKTLIAVPFRRRLELHVPGSGRWSAAASVEEVQAAAHCVLEILSCAAAPTVADSDSNWPDFIEMVAFRATGDSKRNARLPALRIITAEGEHLIDDHVTEGKWLLRDRYPPSTLGELRALFAHRRAGDIQIFAKPNYSTLHGQPGNHGGLNTVDRHIPLYLSANAFGTRRIDEAVRIVDIMPTLMDWLGCREKIPVDIDGRSLLPALQRIAAEGKQDKPALQSKARQ